MSNAIVARKDSLRSLASFLEGRKSYIAKVLPKHLTPERVVKVAITAASRTPALLNCTPESVALAVIQASQLGLEAGSPLGEAYLVPYKSECTLIVGYRGLIALARRSGEIESIEAHVVHARDRFELTFGLEAKLSHTPHMPPPPKSLTDEAMRAWQEESEPGPMIAVYGIARLKGGAVQYEVMTRAQVDAIRGRSRAGGNGPWVSDYEEMARKTVVRRLAKYLPMSIEMAQALDIEDRQDTGESLAEIADIEISANDKPTLPQGKPSATEAMKAQLAAKVSRGAPDPDDEPPPTGTDGPRMREPGDDDGDDGGRDDGGFESHRAAQGARAAANNGPRLVREYSEEDLVTSARAWRGYVETKQDPWQVRGAYRKRASAFEAEGVLAERRAAALEQIAALGEADPATLLDCTTQREREASRKRAA